MNDAHELVTVSYDVTGDPLYNGYRTVHEALWNLEHEFRVLEFADRVLISLDILSDLGSPMIESQNYIYKFEYGIWGEMNCYIFHEGNLEDPIVTWDGQDFIDQGIMKDKYDLNGIFSHFLMKGEFIPEDKLTLMHN